MKKVTPEFIYETLSKEGTITEETVCEELMDDEQESEKCWELCQYAYPQPQCWKRYFEWRAKNERHD